MSVLHVLRTRQSTSRFFMLQLATMHHSLDKRVMNKMIQLAHAGVTQIQEMRRHVKYFLEQELFIGKNVPPESDFKYHPTNKTILNCIYRVRTLSRLTF